MQLISIANYTNGIMSSENVNVVDELSWWLDISSQEISHSPSDEQGDWIAEEQEPTQYSIYVCSGQENMSYFLS